MRSGMSGPAHAVYLVQPGSSDARTSLGGLALLILGTVHRHGGCS